MKNKITIILSSVMAIMLIQINAVAMRIDNRTNEIITIVTTIKKDQQTVTVPANTQQIFGLTTIDPTSRFAFATAHILIPGSGHIIPIFVVSQCSDPGKETNTVYMWDKCLSACAYQVALVGPFFTTGGRSDYNTWASGDDQNITLIITTRP